LKRALRPTTVVDVGAFEGDWRKMARRIRPACKIVVFEPNLQKTAQKHLSSIEAILIRSRPLKLMKGHGPYISYLLSIGFVACEILELSVADKRHFARFFTSDQVMIVAARNIGWRSSLVVRSG
jgi:hypothetical protein